MTSVGDGGGGSDRGQTPAAKDRAAMSTVVPSVRPPKYEVVRRRLRADFTATLAPNEPIPGERALMARYEVSRSTIRQALRGLAEEGVVYRIQGAGTYVADPSRIHKSLSLTSFSEDIRARQMIPGGRVLAAANVEANAEVARDLRLPPGAPVLHVERLRTADGSPMCLENVWLPQDLLPADHEKLLAGSLYEWLRRHGYEPQQADQRIRATVVGVRDAQLLEIPPFSPALLVARTAWSGQRVIERARSLYRADRYEFAMTVVRASNAEGSGSTDGLSAHRR